MARKIEMEIVGDASSVQRAFRTAATESEPFGSKVGSGLMAVGKTAALVAGAAGTNYSLQDNAQTSGTDGQAKNAVYTRFYAATETAGST